MMHMHTVESREEWDNRSVYCNHSLRKYLQSGSAFVFESYFEAYNIYYFNCTKNAKAVENSTKPSAYIKV